MGVSVSESVLFPESIHGLWIVLSRSSLSQVKYRFNGPVYCERRSSENFGLGLL